jgi:hypothetical protein
VCSEIIAGEQFEQRIIKSFDPMTQELYQLLPTNILTKSGIKNNNESIQIEQAQNKLGTTQEPAGSTKIDWRQ